MTACHACTFLRAHGASTKPARVAIASAPRATRFVRSWSRHAIANPVFLPADASQDLGQVPGGRDRYDALAAR